MDKFYCVTIKEIHRERFEDALSDFLCWMDGYRAGGGLYSPCSVEDLRELRETLKAGYETIPPQTKKIK